MDKEIKKELLGDFKTFQTLRKRLLTGPAEFVYQYMAEWDLSSRTEIEENIEHRELSTLEEAARKLGVDSDELNAWLCKHL